VAGRDGLRAGPRRGRGADLPRAAVPRRRLLPGVASGPDPGESDETVRASPFCRVKTLTGAPDLGRVEEA